MAGPRLKKVKTENYSQLENKQLTKLLIVTPLENVCQVRALPKLQSFTGKFVQGGPLSSFQSRPGAYPGGMLRMHVHPPLPPPVHPPPGHVHPPLPSLKGWL